MSPFNADVPGPEPSIDRRGQGRRDVPLPRSVLVVPWTDPVVDLVGHDPRSRYAERFWLSVIGPSALWFMRRVAAGFDESADGFDLDVELTARSLGLSVAKGTASPFARAVRRCEMFGVANVMSGHWAVRRRMPPMSQRHLARLPDELRTEHDAWIVIDDDARSDLAGAIELAIALTRVGDDPSLVEHRLAAAGVAPSTAEVAARRVTATVA